MHRVVRDRVGLGAVELLVAMVVMGIMGAAGLKLFISQTRFADQETKLSAARAVSRAPLNLLLSEARMVETGSGVVSASATSAASSITLRVPLAMGLVCGASGATTVLSMMPTDSVVLGGAALSGYASRGASGYSYTEGAITVSTGNAAVCAAASINTVTGGRVVAVSPAFPAATTPGTAAFFYERVKYGFDSSAVLPGRLGLWRTLEATGTAEELAAPFDTTSRFRFYRNDNDTSDVVVPPVDEIKGIELVLTGTSQKPRFGKNSPENAPLRTAVFFVNRTN